MLVIRQFTITRNGDGLLGNKKHYKKQAAFKAVCLFWFIPLFVWQVEPWH